LSNASHVINSLTVASEALSRLLADSSRVQIIANAGDILSTAIHNGARVFSCGNGGSMCDSIHFAEELSGRYRDDRKGLPAIAISDPGHLSCVGNDYGYEFVFSRYLEAQARPGDVLLGISTSGKSANVIKAAEHARANGMKIITLTGQPNSALGKLADVDVCTPVGKYADRVQELHIKVIHILIELVERHLFPTNYAQSTETTSGCN
jgi:D-sedoheptulose 7-phosphate isomerase